MLSERTVKTKRYFFRGKEISRKKANALVIGACAGMVGAGFGLWILTVFLSALFHAIGGAA